MGPRNEWATGPTPNHMVVTPEVVLLLGSTGDNVSRTVRIGRDFPLGPHVPQWYGDTIGFWDGDALIAWTANVQAWTQHTSWEFSYEIEAIEIFTPARGDDGEPFEEKMQRLVAQLREQQAEGARLDAVIDENITALGFAPTRVPDGGIRRRGGHLRRRGIGKARRLHPV